jgi:hypothetical protein
LDKGIRRQLMKATMLVGQIFISTFVVFCLANADALDASDNARMGNLVRKAIQLRQDVVNVQSGGSHGGNAWECLNELSHNLETVSLRIDGLRSIVFIASSMVDNSDEQAVLKVLNEDATSFLKFVERGRKGINLTAGYCSWNSVAVAKAQEILGFYDEATSDVRSIMKAR